MTVVSSDFQNMLVSFMVLECNLLDSSDATTFFQNEIRDVSEKYKFIELTCKKIQGYENDWSDGFSDDAYTTAIKVKFPNQS